MKEHMPSMPSDMNLEAKRASFELAFGSSRSPLPYERRTDRELLPRIQERAPNASSEEIFDALARVRRLCDNAYEVCDAFRDGGFGEGTSARAAALKELTERTPGFTEAEYKTAFASGLLWTAF